MTPVIFLEALQLYRQVLGMEPDNVEYLLCVAQLYTEMGLFDESNDVLLKIARFGDTPDGMPICDGMQLYGP